MMKTIGICLALSSLLLFQSVAAQSPGTDRPPGQPAQQQEPAEDAFGRATPRGTVSGLIMAAERENLDRAAEYLESGLAPAARQELARQLWVVLDRKLLTGLDRLSDMADGDLDDGFTDRDRVGRVESPSGDVEIVLDRVRRGPGNIWLFSSSMLREIPRLYEEIQPSWIERHAPEWLRATQFLSLPLYRWIAILLLVPLTFLLAGLLTRALSAALRPVFRRLTREPEDHRLPSAGPFRLLILSLLFYGVSYLGVSLAGRSFWHRVAETLMVMALCWLSLRLLDVVAAMSLNHLNRRNRAADTALIRLVNRLLKAATVIVAGLFLLYLSDVDLTAALTGLGVGGLAIGFGAQKTIENLFGGIMVISDKPVNVGDTCRVGEYFGTVEDIGIRSTRIRTLDRTVVSVPNGQLSSMILENFAQRDRIRFQHVVGLGRHATPPQVRCVLTEIRRLLEAHRRVTSARTRLIRFTASSVDIEIFAYVLESDQAVFLAIQEELLLGIMDAIDRSGAPIALPPAAAVVGGALTP